MSDGGERAVSLFLELAPLHGPSRAEEPVAVVVREHLDRLGLPWWEDDAARQFGGTTGNIVADIPATEGVADPRIVFSAHLDVVPPGYCSEPAIQDGIIVSAGDTVLGADDRAGVAAILAAARDWVEDRVPHPPIRLIFCMAEETHLQGSKALDPSALEDCALAYIPDSASRIGNLVASTPTCATFEAVFRGRPAHAGLAPENGRSAIEMLCAAIAAMDLGRIEEETTSNIGSIEGGGATNVVAARAVLHGEVRSFQHDKVGQMLDRYQRLCEQSAHERGGAVDWVAHTGFVAYGWSRGDEVIDRAWKACERLGIEPVLGRSGGGSDANSFNEMGVPSINLGTGTRANHTPEERIPVADLHALYRLLREIGTSV